MAVCRENRQQKKEVPLRVTDVGNGTELSAILTFCTAEYIVYVAWCTGTGN
jgi:hypothetical protein